MSTSDSNEYIRVIAALNRVVRNKNTGQSFLARHADEKGLELMPIMGKNIVIPIEDFTWESWEVMR